MAPMAAPTRRRPCVVPRRERQLTLLHEILRGDETEQRAVAIDERQLLDLVRAHHLFGGGRSARRRWTTSRSRGVILPPTVPATIDEPQIARRQQP